MKNKDASQIIAGLFKELRKHASQITEDPDEEQIHDFRVCTKKLRAVLRMIREHTNNSSPGIPRRISDIYHKLGAIRDIQICSAKLEETEYSVKDSFPHFKKMLDKKILDLYKDLDKFPGKAYWENKRNKIIQRIPKDLHEDLYLIFFKTRFEQIYQIINPACFEDEELHLIRKDLKDIIYVNEQLEINELSDVFYPLFTEDQKLIFDVLASVLGQFVDMKKSILLLNDFRNNLTHEEKPAYDSLYLMWEEEKLTFKQEAINLISESFITVGAVNLSPGYFMPS